jgi:hypothetical protein
MTKHQITNKFKIQSGKFKTAPAARVLNLGLFALCLFVIWCLVIGASAQAAPGASARADDRAADDFFTIVVLPDTQYYTEVQWKAEQYFKGQTRWIVDHRADEHIAFVSHVGDLQQDGTFLRTDDHQSDPEVKELLVNIDPNNPPKNTRQWQRADEAMRIMDDADVPYVAGGGPPHLPPTGAVPKPRRLVY